jgi:hypothetical protein
MLLGNIKQHLFKMLLLWIGNYLLRKEGKVS